GFFYSWINSYFSKDKIYVVCEQGEESLVYESCDSINEENIIIEPKRINYNVSVFYATLIIGKILPESRLFCFPINFMFAENFKMGGIIFAASEMVLKDWIVIPTVSIVKSELIGENVVEGGKILCNLKGIDFFEVENFTQNKENNKKKKIFGKQGKNLNIIFGKQKIIKEYFLKYCKEIFIKNLYNCFKYDSIVWDDIVSEYNNADQDIVNYDFFHEVKNFLTIFIDTRVYCMDNWHNFMLRFSANDGNIISGVVVNNNSKNVVCINYDTESVDMDSLRNTVVFRKNGNVAIRSINQE
ncbi:MAG TPA: hypothetical protein PK771_10235, partial [Spirochaetota bacterium]|nr:hypothetical protein [Spirochaetota bacterium]